MTNLPRTARYHYHVGMNWVLVSDWAKLNRIKRQSAVNLCRTGRLGDAAKREIIKTTVRQERLSLDGEPIGEGTEKVTCNVRWFVLESVKARKVAKKNKGKEFERWEIE